MEPSVQEQQVKKLKRVLEGWRMAILPLKSVLLWEQQWHPAAIFGTVSLIHFFIWLLDLNFLTTIAVVGLIVNLVDFIVPIICTSICGANEWTGQKEKIFEDVCRSLVSTYNAVYSNLRSYCSLRESSPYLYYVITLCMLFFLAWLASSINNIFLLYILSTTMLLWPGIQNHGLLNAVLSMVNMAPKTKKM